jgi:two-component system LytT family response regulator
MITTIIIDDEPKGRLALRQKLSGYCSNVQVVAEAANGKEALALIQKHQPQLIFLDIEMPVMNGFEMLNAIREKNFHIIFTTAYDQYAIKAIKYAAFDYLLKPIDIEELRLAISKIETVVNINLGKQVNLMLQNFKQPKRNFTKVAIPTLEGLFFFDINTIIYMEANSNYTTFYFTNNPKVTASRTLKELEDFLPGDIFFRLHHSFIININYIRRFIKSDGAQVEMTNGALLEISRRKRDEFLKLLGQA